MSKIPLTNISADSFERLDSIVRKASFASGLIVTAHQGPIPKDFTDPEDNYYLPDPTDFSIWTEEAPNTDLGPFWLEFDRLYYKGAA